MCTPDSSFCDICCSYPAGFLSPISFPQYKILLNNKVVVLVKWCVLPMARIHTMMIMVPYCAQGSWRAVVFRETHTGMYQQTTHTGMYQQTMNILLPTAKYWAVYLENQCQQCLCKLLNNLTVPPGSDQAFYFVTVWRESVLVFALQFQMPNCRTLVPLGLLEWRGLD